MAAEKKNEVPAVEIDLDAADLALDPVTEPVQVEPVKVLYMPLKDFEARVNQDVFQFRQGIRTKISRDLAADLSRDPKNGYVMEQ